MKYSKQIESLLNYNATHSTKRENTMHEPMWLIYAADTTGSAITFGSITNYKSYSPLNSYREELKIINKQISGECGIYAANLIVNVPRDGVSVQFFSAFCAKTALGSVIVTEVVGSQTGPVTRQTIKYTTCKIEHYTNLMNSVEMSINYSARNETYNAYSQGTKSGSYNSTFSG